ncbi:MAG: hypothetical protein ACERKD_12530 [Prolixibacteraceae bacterium]
MKKTLTIFTVILFLLISAKTNAQGDFRVGISMGSVIPVHEFKNNDYKNLPAGFAQSGFNLSFDGDYYFINRMAVSARFNFGMSSMDKVAVSDWLDNQMADYLNSELDKNLYSIDYWQWSAPMLGLKYNYPLVLNKLYLEVAGFSGLSIVQTPSQNLKIIDTENKQSIYSENIAGKSLSVPFMFDAGFRYLAADNIQLKLQAGYFQTQVSYEHVNYIVKDEANEIWKELKRNQQKVPLKTLTLSIGIIYKLEF